MAGAPAKFEVLLTEGVEQDLESIHDYISESTAWPTPITCWMS
jgi:hypothetical protein